MELIIGSKIVGSWVQPSKTSKYKDKFHFFENQEHSICGGSKNILEEKQLERPSHKDFKKCKRCEMILEKQQITH